jgi:hypothetical protein
VDSLIERIRTQQAELAVDALVLAKLHRRLEEMGACQ